MNKICTKCNVSKSLNSFLKDRTVKGGYKHNCKSCVKEYRQGEGYRIKSRLRCKRYRESDNGKLVIKRITQSQETTDYHREWQSKKYNNDRGHRLCSIQRARISAALGGRKKSKSTLNIIGCTAKELEKHIESQFDNKMNWNNYGTYWHIDHKFPLSIALNISMQKFEEACHYTNLQPLEAVENIIKSNKITI